MKTSLLLFLFLSLGTLRSGVSQDRSDSGPKEQVSESPTVNDDVTPKQLAQDVHSLFSNQTEQFKADLKELEKNIKIVTETLGADHRITVELILQRKEMNDFLDSVILEPSESELKRVKEGLAFKPRFLDFTGYDQPKYPALVRIRRLRNSKFDGFVFFYRGQVIRKFLDTDKNQKLDQWIYFKEGMETYRDLDIDGDTNVDSAQLTKGDIVDLLIDENGDGEIENVYRGSVSDLRSSISNKRLQEAEFAKADLAFDETTGKVKKSEDLDRDKLLMWKTVPNKTGKFHVSPMSAINASRRVFETVTPELEGKKINEIRELIGYRERPMYGYHAPFWEIKEHAYVYRFDCGMYGWQYNLYLDNEKAVKRVEIKWIH